jgi:hypothetical protein
MRRNKRTKRCSEFTLNTMHIAAIVLSLFIMLMAYWVLDSRCGAIGQEIGAAEKALAKLDGELERETMKWNEMKTPERLELALKKHGLNMNNPAPDQVIKMMPNGRVAPRQMSVVRAQRRNAGTVSRTVQDTTPQKALAPKRAARKVVR